MKKQQGIFETINGFVEVPDDAIEVQAHYRQAYMDFDGYDHADSWELVITYRTNHQHAYCGTESYTAYLTPEGYEKAKQWIKEKLL